MGKKALVMGGSYFIGKKIVEVLLSNSYEVYTLNRGTKQPDDNRTRLIIADRNDQDLMNAVLKDLTIDIVIDVSCLNKTQAHILCEALEEKQVENFVFISSSSVYDVEHLSVPFIETDRLSENRFWTDYGRNKIEAESCYSDYFLNTKTNLVILRPPYVYGENNYAQRESFVFDHVCKGMPILIPASNPLLQFIYTEDLANTIIHLLNHPIGQVSVFNIGNETPLTAAKWVESCEEAASRQARIIYYDNKKDGRSVRDFFPFHDYDNVLDVTKIHSIFPYETPFQKGLEASFNWYLENRSHIEFKETVSHNEKQILERLGIN